MIQNGKEINVCTTRKTGLSDRKGVEIKEGDEIKYTPDIYNILDNAETYIYKVHYGIGTFDSGNYQYVGFYLGDEDGNRDGNSSILFETDLIEIIKRS
ncbi:acetyltransferase [Clostridium sporogenes]